MFGLWNELEEQILLAELIWSFCCILQTCDNSHFEI